MPPSCDTDTVMSPPSEMQKIHERDDILPEPSILSTLEEPETETTETTFSILSKKTRRSYGAVSKSLGSETSRKRSILEDISSFTTAQEEFGISEKGCMVLEEDDPSSQLVHDPCTQGDDSESVSKDSVTATDSFQLVDDSSAREVECLDSEKTESSQLVDDTPTQEQPTQEQCESSDVSPYDKADPSQSQLVDDTPFSSREETGTETDVPENCSTEPEPIPASQEMIHDAPSRSEAPVALSDSQLNEAIDRLFFLADKDNVTVGDVVRALEDEFQFKFVKKQKKFVRNRLTGLILGDVRPVKEGEAEEVAEEEVDPREKSKASKKKKRRKKFYESESEEEEAVRPPRRHKKKKRKVLKQEEETPPPSSEDDYNSPSEDEHDSPSEDDNDFPSGDEKPKRTKPSRRRKKSHLKTKDQLLAEKTEREELAAAETQKLSKKDKILLEKIQARFQTDTEEARFKRQADFSNLLGKLKEKREGIYEVDEEEEVTLKDLKIVDKKEGPKLTFSSMGCVNLEDDEGEETLPVVVAIKRHSPNLAKSKSRADMRRTLQSMRVQAGNKWLARELGYKNEEEHVRDCRLVEKRRRDNLRRDEELRGKEVSKNLQQEEQQQEEEEEEDEEMVMAREVEEETESTQKEQNGGEKTEPQSKTAELDNNNVDMQDDFFDRDDDDNDDNDKQHEANPDSPKPNSSPISAQIENSDSMNDMYSSQQLVQDTDNTDANEPSKASQVSTEADEPSKSSAQVNTEAEKPPKTSAQVNTEAEEPPKTSAQVNTEADEPTSTPTQSPPESTITNLTQDFQDETNDPNPSQQLVKDVSAPSSPITDPTPQDLPPQPPKHKNSAYRQLLQQEAQRSKKKRSAFVDGEAAEEEDDDMAIGLENFGFALPSSSQKKPDGDNDEKYKLEEEDLENIVDELSDNEGDEHEGNLRRKEMEVNEEKVRHKEMIRRMRDGYDGRRGGVASGVAVRGVHRFDQLVAADNRQQAKRLGLLNEDEMDSDEEKEMEDDQNPEEEDENVLLDKMLKDRFLSKKDQPEISDDEESEDEVEDEEGVKVDKEEQERERLAKRFTKRAKMNRLLEAYSGEEQNELLKKYSVEEQFSQSRLMEEDQSSQSIKSIHFLKRHTSVASTASNTSSQESTLKRQRSQGSGKTILFSRKQSFRSKRTSFLSGSSPADKRKAVGAKGFTMKHVLFQAGDSQSQGSGALSRNSSLSRSQSLPPIKTKKNEASRGPEGGSSLWSKISASRLKKR